MKIHFLKSALCVLIGFINIILFNACENTHIASQTGYIIATLGCYDSGHVNFYRGFIIKTDKNDTILSFNFDDKDSIDIQYGEHILSPSVFIPYSFSYVILNSNDRRFIHYETPAQTTLLLSLPTPLDKIDQVYITPIK